MGYTLSQETISHALRERLITELGKGDDIRLALSKVEIFTVPTNIAQNNLTQMTLSLSISGITHKKYLTDINKILSVWGNNSVVITTINDCNIYIEKIETGNLFGI